MSPATSARRGNLAGVELASNRVVTGVAGRLNLSDNGQNIGRELTAVRYRCGATEGAKEDACRERKWGKSLKTAARPSLKF